MNRQRLIEGGIFTALGLAIVMFSLEYTYMDRFTPGPGLFPFWLAVALTSLGAILFLSGVRSSAQEKNTGFKVKSLVPFGILALFVGSMNYLGAMIAIALFTVILIRFITPKTSWVRTVSVGVLLSLACYGIFDRLLGVPLPIGFLGI